MKVKRETICISTIDEDSGWYYDENEDELPYGTPFIIDGQVKTGRTRVYTPTGPKELNLRDLCYIEVNPKMWLEINKAIKMKQKHEEVAELVKHATMKESIASFAKAVGMSKELIKV